MIKIPWLNINFFSDVKRIEEKTILNKLHDNTRLSLSFITLLVGSALICTLGLLINSTPIVIGGMIIAPLMWPLVKLALGVTFGEYKYIREGALILLISVLVALVSAIIIAFISPIKQLNAEIISRTTPTLIDLIIALVAGGIAALAITQTRISESLAGVAIATSLMPPLCVSGIGLALLDYSIFAGALLLFVSNSVAIVFMAVVVFILVGLEDKQNEKEKKLRKKGLALMAILLVLIGVWLYFLLRNYSFKIVAYNKVQDVLEESFGDISPSIYIEGVKAEVSTFDSSTVKVEAEVWLPGDTTIDYEQQQAIVELLQQELGREVDLNLRIQNTISIVSQEDIWLEKKQKEIREVFLEEIAKINSALGVDLINVGYDDEENVFVVDAVLRGDPSINMTEEQREGMEMIISQTIGDKILLNIEIISRVQLQSEPEVENEQIKKEAKKLVGAISEDVDIASVSLQTLSSVKTSEDDIIPTKILVSLELKVPEDYEISDQVFEYIKNQLESQFEKQFQIEVKLIKKQTYEF